MTGAVCPYCRGPINAETDTVVVCEGCDTPHHGDCYQENGGCTVFGCKNGPADEPKVHVTSPELSNVSGMATTAAAPAMLYPYQSTPRTTTSDPSMFVQEDHKSKVTFVILGVLLGALGAHNFYAGYRNKAFMQLGITVLTLGYGAPMSWIWAVIDICTVDQDNLGVQFRS